MSSPLGSRASSPGRPCVSFYWWAMFAPASPAPCSRVWELNVTCVISLWALCPSSAWQPQACATAQQQGGPLLISLLRAASSPPAQWWAGSRQTGSLQQLGHLAGVPFTVPLLCYVCLASWRFTSVDHIGTIFLSKTLDVYRLLCSSTAGRVWAGAIFTLPPTTQHVHQATRSSRVHCKQPPEAGFAVAMSLLVSSFSCPFIHR